LTASLLAFLVLVGTTRLATDAWTLLAPELVAKTSSWEARLTVMPPSAAAATLWQLVEGAMPDCRIRRADLERGTVTVEASGCLPEPSRATLLQTLGSAGWRPSMRGWSSTVGSTATARELGGWRAGLGGLLVQSPCVPALIAILAAFGLGLGRRADAPTVSTPRAILWGLGATLVQLPVLALLLALALQVLQGEAPPQIDGAADPTGLWPPHALLIALVGPLLEELLFRRQIFRGLQPALGTPGATLLSSALFAAAHNIHPFSVFAHTVAGLVLAWLYDRTGSFAAPFAAHASWNAAVLAVVSLA
jgi:membrane protease YdiL (CAAX protease family)